MEGLDLATLLEQGATVVLAAVIVFLWRENKALRNESRDTLVAWRDDKSDTVTKVTDALNNTASSIKSFNDKIDVVQRRR